MKVPYGPHQRQGRRRRLGKLAVLCALLAAMAAASSWTTDKPRPARALPDESAIAWMVNRSAYSPGDARGFAEQYPELAELFLNAKPKPDSTPGA